MLGLMVCVILLICAFLTMRYVDQSDILAAGMLISAGLFYIGMYLSLIWNKVDKLLDSKRNRSEEGD